MTRLLTALITLSRLNRACTCDGYNTGVWGHLDTCPRRRWYHRGRERLITDLIGLDMLRTLIQDAAHAELRARHANPGLAGGLDPGAVADGTGRRAINALADRHLL